MMKNIVLMLALCVLFSSCAAGHIKRQGSLDEWDASKVYDPVTGRYYHTAKLPTAQEAQHQAFVDEIIEGRD